MDVYYPWIIWENSLLLSLLPSFLIFPPFCPSLRGSEQKRRVFYLCKTFIIRPVFENGNNRFSSLLIITLKAQVSDTFHPRPLYPSPLVFHCKIPYPVPSRGRIGWTHLALGPVSNHFAVDVVARYRRDKDRTKTDPSVHLFTFTYLFNFSTGLKDDFRKGQYPDSRKINMDLCPRG